MLTVSKIAELTGYTARQIQLECKHGHLKGLLATRKSGWQITHADYVSWRSAFKAWRKPYKRSK